MRVTILCRPGTFQEAWCQAMHAGLARHGISATIMPEPKDMGDVVVGWGWRKMAALARWRRVLVLEMGYVGDRWQWTSCLFDGLNGRGRHPGATDAGDRWRRLFGNHVRPWRTDGDYALIIGQVSTDQALRGFPIGRWYAATTARLRALDPDLPIYFRPHPVDVRNGTSPRVPGAEQLPGTLEDAIASARVVVTVNSNVGVLAALAGVPVVAVDRGAMCWPVAGHAVGEVVRPDRAAWCADLAWAQWRLEEIASGEAWEHLRSGLDGDVSRETFQRKGAIACA